MGTTPAPGQNPGYDEMSEHVTGQLPHVESPPPIDVRVVDTPEVEPPRTITVFSVPVPADGSAVRVVPEIRSRRSLVLQLVAGQPNIVLGGPNVTPGTGFLLTSAPLRLSATSAVWACVATTGAASAVTALAELVEG